MRNLKEIIKNLTQQDYTDKKVNLHIHTNYSDGEGDFVDITNQARNMYNLFAITDHNTVKGHIDYPASGAVVGVEFDVWYKYIFLHLLAYDFAPEHEAMKRFYAKNKKGTEKDIIRIFSRRNIKDLISAIHEAGGIAILAHPANCWALSMDKFIKDLKNIGLDGVEVYYPYPRWRKFLKFSSPDKIEKIADKYNLLKTGGTDCHSNHL